MKLQSFVVALLLLFGTKLLAQDMPTVQLGPLYTDAQYRSWDLPSRSVLKLHEGKIYAMLPRLVKSEKIWGLDFVVFDEEMQFEKQVHIPLEATKKYKFRQFLRLAGQAYIIFSYNDPKSRSITLMAQALDLDLMAVKGSMRIIGDFPSFPSLTQNNILFTLSPNRSKLLIKTYLQSGDQNTRHLIQYYKLIVLDEDLNTLWEYEPEFDPKTDLPNFYNSFISDGGVVVWTRQNLSEPLPYKQQGKETHFEIIANGKLIANNWIDKEHSLIINHLTIVSDAKQTLTCAGIAGTNMSEVKGYFIVKYSLEDGSILSRKFIPLNFQALADPRDGELKYLRLIWIWEKTSEEILLMFQSLEPPLNGGMTPGLPILGDFFLVYTQGNGESIWTKRIPQSRGAIPLDYLINEEHIDFFYHQRPYKEGKEEPRPQYLPTLGSYISKETKLMHIQLDWDGKQTQQTLVDNGETGYGLWPFTEGAYEDESVVFLGFAWNKVRFIKLTY